VILLERVDCPSLSFEMCCVVVVIRMNNYIVCLVDAELPSSLGVPVFVPFSERCF
jgi:hypothetical protein